MEGLLGFSELLWYTYCASACHVSSPRLSSVVCMVTAPFTTEKTGTGQSGDTSKVPHQEGLEPECGLRRWIYKETMV